MRLRELFEAPATAVMAFGRMNPPTIGHAKLVDAIKSQPGDPFIFLSQSQKPKTDPLSFEDKLRYAKFFFPNVTIGNPEVKTIIQALQKVESLGYQQLIYVAGSDRVQAFEELLNKYNGKDFTFKSIKVVSAGERDPDADGAEGMSASKMRQAAADNDIESFKQGVPQQEVADEMFAAVRKGMGVKDEVPAESIQENISVADFPDTAEDILSAYDLKFSPKDKTSLDRAHRVLKSRKDLRLKAYELYDKLGQGFGSQAYDAISNVIQQKKAQLKNIAKQEIERQGLTGADALHSETSQKRIQADNLLDSILSHAMAITGLAGATMRGNNARLKSDPQYKEYDFNILVPRDRELLAQSPYGQKNNAESIQEAENPAVAQKIKPLKMSIPPKAPDATIPRTRDGHTKNNGTTYVQDKYDDNIMHVSDGGGTYTFDGNRLIKWTTPRFKGVRQIHNFVQSTIKVDADIEIKTKDGPALISTDAVYDLKGNLKNAGKLSTSSAGFGVSFGNDEFNMDYVISDNLSIHLTGHPRKGKVSPKQIKAINNFIPKSEKGGLQQLINLANKAKEIGAKVTFKSPANQGAIPYRQAINMLKQADK